MTQEQQDKAIKNLAKCVRLICGNYGLKQEDINELLKVIEY